MKLKNSTDFDDGFLRRMTSWCARELGIPMKIVKAGEFTNCSWSYRGRAWRRGRRFLVRVGPPQRFPAATNHAGYADTFADPIEALVHVTAHELYHLHQYSCPASPVMRKYARKEPSAERAATRALAAFRPQRPALLSAWSGQAPARAAACPPPSRPSPEVFAALEAAIGHPAVNAPPVPDRPHGGPQMAEPTRRPWRRSNPTGLNVWGPPGDDKSVAVTASTVHGVRPLPERLANSDLIVRAVNAWDDPEALAARLRELTEAGDQGGE